MRIGIGNTVPERVSLPGQSGGAPTPPALAQVNNVYSMEFDGASTSIDLGSSVLFNSTQGFSVSAWVNLTSYNPGYPNIVNLSTNQSDNFILSLSNQSGYTGVFFGSPSQFARGRTTGDISGDFIGVWKHVCLTFNGVDRTLLSSYKIYVDGSSVALVSAGSIGAVTSVNSIGDGGSSIRYFNGKIDEVSIFNVELTAQEVSSIYNATETGKTADLNDLTTPPIKWYRMGD
jgi:hypothetical protein